VLLVILGPTAAGKSALAEYLAPRLDGEVVGVDSMQVYRGLEVGTAKPGPEVRSRVPYHLVDVADPAVDFNLGDFVRCAEAAVEDIQRRGKVPILAGGTGMYLRGFLKGIDPAPPRDPATRGALEALAVRRGDAHLHRLLSALDPEAAAAVGAADRMRLVRALERVLLSGRPARVSRWAGADRYASLKIGLEWEPEALRRRIDERVEALFRDGLVQETAGLMERLPDGVSALKALGYREVVGHLRGEADLDQTIQAVKRNTWRFSRRQMTWFRREEEVRWFPVDPARPQAVCLEVEKYAKLGLSSG
jgi:tRNA dimethylallyltransferase